MPDIPILADRIKELSYTTGTQSFQLSGAVNGFSGFADVYNSGDVLFYAVTDGTDYEVGSGIYNDDTIDFIQRFPIRSSNSNNLVSFSAGTKEIYVTYPATHSVLTGSGISNFNFANNKGVAFWASSNILNYDNALLWDSGTSRLSINKPIPLYSIDIGGTSSSSSIRASGFYVGVSGVTFPSGTTSPNYIGGKQLEHFERNVLADANIQDILELSGVVSQYIWLKKQNEGLVFAGPASGCSGPCSPNYPTFRTLVRDDYPFLMEASGALNFDILTSGTSFLSDLSTASGALNTAIIASGTNFLADLSTASGALSTDMIASGSITSSNIISVSGAIESQIYDTNIYELGTVSGIVSLDWARNKLIQNATLNGFPTTFNQGAGWPTNNIARDLTLKLTTNVDTDITWNIIGSNWYNKPSGTTLNSGEYMFSLKAFGSGIVYGFYLGKNTGSL